MPAYIPACRLPTNNYNTFLLVDMASRFEAVGDKINFSEEEEKILLLWGAIDAFQTSLKLSEGRPEFTFYDGPPFATGLPHYGYSIALPIILPLL